MKVGDYVRIKDGTYTCIGKIKRFEQTNCLHIIIDYSNNEDFNESDWFEWNVIESSSDILDLLKPMDLLYIDIDNDYSDGIIVPRIAETYCELKQIINEIKLGNYILKGVVTKEQLENCMYKVGE